MQDQHGAHQFHAGHCEEYGSGVKARPQKRDSEVHQAKSQMARRRERRLRDFSTRRPSSGRRTGCVASRTDWTIAAMLCASVLLSMPRSHITREMCDWPFSQPLVNPKDFWRENNPTGSRLKSSIQSDSTTAQRRGICAETIWIYCAQVQDQSIVSSALDEWSLCKPFLAATGA